jgi:hypothetical protein
MTKMQGLELGRICDIPTPSVVIVNATTTDVPTISTLITAMVLILYKNILNFLSVELDF